MCCFSRPVKLVADTEIFARDAKEDRQYLVYSMRVSAGEDLAMILPIPVPKKSKEDAVRFINLEKYPDFFMAMRRGFPMPPSRGAHSNLSKADGGKEPLKVVEVGSFEASFVPAIKDFERLDERFRLPSGVWEKLPQYSAFGFAVFKLKQGAKKIHPMAFEFPRADPKQLFFPTVHIHDGKVHDKARFDHALYCQSDSAKMMDWKESPQLARQFLDVDRTQGIVDGTKHCYRKPMQGILKNEDLLV